MERKEYTHSFQRWDEILITTIGPVFITEHVVTAGISIFLLALSVPYLFALSKHFRS